MFAALPQSLQQLAQTAGTSIPDGKKAKLYNMVYLLRPTTPAMMGSDGAPGLEVLLGHKARGHGAGNWNGFGGKVEPKDGSIVDAAARELEEECGLKCDPTSLQRRGIIWFQYPEQPFLMEVHVYIGWEKHCAGQVVESEEMTPISWVPTTEIPLDKMWKDDPFWLPQLFDAVQKSDGTTTHCFTAFFDFAEGFKDIVHQAVAPRLVGSLEECHAFLSEVSRSDRVKLASS